MAETAAQGKYAFPMARLASLLLRKTQEPAAGARLPLKSQRNCVSGDGHVKDKAAAAVLVVSAFSVPGETHRSNPVLVLDDIGLM